MTLATLAPVSGNQTGIWIVLALVTVLAIAAVLWQHERVSDRHDDTLADHTKQLAELAYQMPKLLEFLDIEINEPVSDDSPEAMAAGDVTDNRAHAGEITNAHVSDDVEPDDAPTDEFPIVSDDTIPDGIPLAVQSALIDRRPSPVPRELMSPEAAERQRAERAAFVEEQLAKFDFSGRSK